MIRFSLLSGVCIPTWKKIGKRFSSRLFCALLICIAGQLWVTVAKAYDVSRVDQVKVAFVLNIARFVTWPSESLSSQNSHMRLCLYRNNPLLPALETIKNEKVKGRPIETRQIQRLTESSVCSILLIAKNDLSSFIGEAPSDFNQPLLTIVDLTESDLPVESRRGIIIALTRKGSRIDFDIDLKKSRRSGLLLSSELLKLANIVGGND